MKIVERETFGSMNPPWLRLTRGRRWWSVSWGDGLVLPYLEFQRAVEQSSMNDEIEAAWRRWCPARKRELSREAELSWGGVHGSATGVSEELARELFDIVRRHFRQAFDAAQKEWAAQEPTLSKKRLE